MKRTLLVTTLLSLFAVGNAFGQVNKAVSMTVDVVLSLGVTNELTFGNVTQPDLDAGSKVSSTNLTVERKANVPNKIQVQAAASTFGFANLTGRSYTPSKPISDLQLSTTGTWTSPISLSATAQDLLPSAAAGTSTHTVNSRILVDYNTVPGTYSTTLTFTIVEG